MVLWGLIWGAVLGLLWPGHDWEMRVAIGAVLGFIAGQTLRKAIRKEIAQAQPVAVAAPARQPAPARAASPAEGAPAPAAERITPVAPAATTLSAQDFEDTSPLERVPPAAPRPIPAAPAAPTAPGLVEQLAGRARDWLFGGNTVVRMGVLVLFVGLAFLAKYAVDNALLPPELRLAAIGAAGIALFVTGVRLARRTPVRRGFAISLQGAGVAVLYLTVFAAFRLYQFLPAGAAFAALGAVCAFSAVIALAQNAQALAFIGFAGGFAAPVLVSTGQGNHVALFAYFLLLGVAIAAIAWAKAWRALNLLGFFATFGIATAWGVLRYAPGQFASTEPFLVAFFAVYLTASLLYALRHSHAPRQGVDATLVFGVPIVAFGLQAGLVRGMEFAAAYSALALGALYLVLGWVLMRAQRGDPLVRRWLAECFLALGVGFATLAVPLALDGHWTAAVWAVEGAGVYWMGRRQGRWLARASGLALQVLAAVFYAESLTPEGLQPWPVANPVFIGAAMLAGAALAIAWWSRTLPDPAHESGTGIKFAQVEAALSPGLFWIGFLWAQFGLHAEAQRATVDLQGLPVPVLAPAAQVLLHVLSWVGAAFALHHLALPARRTPWPVAATPAWTTLPVMLLAALWGMASQDHVFQAGGWAAWPLAIVLHLVMLRRLDAGPPQRWWPWVHAGGVWLAVLLAGNLLVFAIGRAQLWQTAWATVVLLVAASAVLLVLARPAHFHAQRWPLAPFAHAYLWRAAAPLAVLLALGACIVAVQSNGNARPLPYVPLLNPTDLSVALALAACALWLVRVRASTLAVPHAVHGRIPAAVLAAIAFIALNTVWLRVAHHYAGVAWDADVLFASFLVQAGYSILWTLVALALMVGAHRRGWRTGWMLGAGLLGLTVLKLFVIDLSNRGGTERIFTFIAVGLLMLIVGWFAPLPPTRKTVQDAPMQEATP